MVGDQDLTEIDLALPRGARIGGTVTAADGTPLAGVTLDARDPEGEFINWAITDTNGRYTMQQAFEPFGTFASAGNVGAFPQLRGGGASAADVGAFPQVLGGDGADATRADADPPAAVSAIDSSVDKVGACQPDATTLCLNQGRFQHRVQWTAPNANSGVGQSTPLTPDTGSFWFFNRENVELVVKVLDGRAINGRFWVFYGSLSDVEYTLTVTDTETGEEKTYINPQGAFASVGDTAAFPL